VTAKEAAHRYVRKIRNDAKREYAERYLRYRLGLAAEPESPANLSVMGAQAVRISLAEILGEAGRTSNPGRPPKQWMRRCIAGVEAGGKVRDAGAVCGAQWHHKMSPAKKRAAVRKERRGNPEGNPYARFSNPHGGE